MRKFIFTRSIVHIAVLHYLEGTGTRRRSQKKAPKVSGRLWELFNRIIVSTGSKIENTFKFGYFLVNVLIFGNQNNIISKAAGQKNNIGTKFSPLKFGGV